MPASYVIGVRTGATLARQPSNEADAEATVRDLIAPDVDFEAGPLAIDGRDFTTYGVTPASVFNACTFAHVERARPAPISAPATVSSVAALLRRAFDARITDTIRPMNASYGARYSWHKFGQAVDFVPARGVGTIDREQICGLMNANGVRLIQLLGPGDRGHSNHWHLAFARPGQVTDHLHPVEEDEDWVVDVTSVDALHAAPGTGALGAPASVHQSANQSPPQWDVFGQSERRALHGGGS